MNIYLPQVLIVDKKNMEHITLGKVEKGNARLLLIDDEEFILDSASIILKKLGYSVNMCRNGNEAIIFYKDN